MANDRGEYTSDSCDCPSEIWGDNNCDLGCDSLECFYDYGDCGCNSDCFIYLGDGTCHTDCNTYECHNDGSDCTEGQKGESIPGTGSSSSDSSVDVTFIAGIVIGGCILLLLFL